ncbi:MAG: glutamate-cysteine ligase family protein [Verrucomicrobiota bacterium]|nr:glutamate-cysteine ligase family protein [Verrucomicrobiota bacterium]
MSDVPSPTPPTSYPLFTRFGAELEYMVVDATTLDVQPIVDKITGAYSDDLNEYEHGAITWSNELTAHVMELKTAEPVATLQGVAEQFQADVQFINAELAKHGCCLLPTAMHPWMNPATETVLWPHDNKEIYQAFNRIFDCRGHGWSNLQSAHLNLPFANDAEFAILHHAIRVLLPLLPGLAASSPYVEGSPTACLDNRLRFYQNNCRAIPAVTGQVIPEPVNSISEYHETVLQTIYTAIADEDPESILQYEWLNARGAIARFERNTIEIRVLDVQECPRMDLAIHQAIVAVLKWMCGRFFLLKDWETPIKTEVLKQLFDRTLIHGEDATIEDTNLLGYYHITSHGEPVSVSDAWWEMLKYACSGDEPWLKDIEFILRRGCLARRIKRAIGPGATKERMTAVYAELAACLQAGRPFDV